MNLCQNMPSATKGSTKIFVGNLSSQVTSEILRELFEQQGQVVECDVLKNYGFVHLDSPENAERAILALNGHMLCGQSIVVEASTNAGRKEGFSNDRGAMAGIRRGGTKIFVGNLSTQAAPDFIRKKFEEFGTVMECDILKNYGFVHLDTPENAQKAIAALNGLDIHGQKMTVEASTSDVRRNPGMGGANRCFRCGSAGHWSKSCPDAPDMPRRPGAFRSRRTPYPPPRERYNPYDRYDPCDPYGDRYVPPSRLYSSSARRPASPPAYQQRLQTSSRDNPSSSYNDYQGLPPHDDSYSAPPPSSSRDYYPAESSSKDYYSSIPDAYRRNFATEPYPDRSYPTSYMPQRLPPEPSQRDLPGSSDGLTGTRLS